MTWTPDGWYSASLADWLAVLRNNTQVECGVTAEVSDQRYILARLLLVLGNEFARTDTAFGSAYAALDPTVAFGRALDIAAYRLGLRRLGPARTVITGKAYGSPEGLVFGGQLVRDRATSAEWQISAGTVGPFGYAEVTAAAVAFGAVPAALGGGQAAWERVSTLAGWSGFESLSAVTLGREIETDAALLLRLQQAEAALGGTEAGVLTALAQVSNIGVWRAYFNRSGEVDDNGIPGHHIEVVAPGALDIDIARALRAGASGTAGFWGNTPVQLPSLQVGGTPVDVPISRPAALRVFARCVALVTGAEIAAPADLTVRIRVLFAAWGATLQPGENPVAAEAEQAVKAGLPKGCVVKLTITFSRALAGPYTDGLEVLAREDPKISNAPSQGAIVSPFSGPYAVTPGWVLEFEAEGGIPLISNLDGTETDAAAIVARINGEGWATVRARLTGAGFEVYRVASGSAYSIVMTVGTSVGAIVAFLLDPWQTVVFGGETDIEVSTL